MTQEARPASDLFTGNWTPTPVYAQIKTQAPPDTTYVSSPLDPSPDSFEVTLTPLAWPAPGPQTVLIRLQSLNPDVSNVTVLLLQGTAIVASWSLQPPGTFTTYPLTLTPDEVQSITDYTNLRLQVIAALGSSSSASGIQIPCCPNPFPNTLYATLVNVNNCNCLNGAASIPLIYDSATNTWIGSGPFGTCGRNINISFWCLAGFTGCLSLLIKWTFSDACEPGLDEGPNSCVCTPLSATFWYRNALGMGNCGCTATPANYNVVVTP